MAKVARRKDSSGTNNNNNDTTRLLDTAPMSEEARRAVEAAKSGEGRLAAQLGYNPYETNKATAGQARTATVAMTHGSVGGGGGTPAAAPPTSSNQLIPTVAPPREPTTPANNDSGPTIPVSPQFHEAFEVLVTSNQQETVKNSLGIMRKLMVNATTKGQNVGDPNAAKFRKVRLTNAKIQAAITNVHGALDIMMSIGFQLAEEGGESYLVYPAPFAGPKWLSTALKQMEKYETS